MYIIYYFPNSKWICQFEFILCCPIYHTFLLSVQKKKYDYNIIFIRIYYGNKWKAFHIVLNLTHHLTLLKNCNGRNW